MYKYSAWPDDVVPTCEFLVVMWSKSRFSSNLRLMSCDNNFTYHKYCDQNDDNKPEQILQTQDTWTKIKQCAISNAGTAVGNLAANFVLIMDIMTKYCSGSVFLGQTRTEGVFFLIAPCIISSFVWSFNNLTTLIAVLFQFCRQLQYTFPKATAFCSSFTSAFQTAIKPKKHTKFYFGIISFYCSGQFGLLV